MLKKLSAALVLTSALALAVPASAHHSFASFDRTKTGTVTGVVRALEWQNPHVWLWVNTVGANGAVVPWGFEAAAPAELARQGFDRHSLNVGDKVTVTYSPLRDGRNGGSMSKIVKGDGTVVMGGGRGGPPGGPPPGGGAGGPPGGGPGGPGGPGGAPPGGAGGPPGGAPPQ